MSAFVQDIWEQSKQGTMELVREVLWSWNESLHNCWTAIVTNRLLANVLQFGAIVLGYLWAKQRGMNVALIVFAVTAFYVYRYLDGECHRVSMLEGVFSASAEETKREKLEYSFCLRCLLIKFGYRNWTWIALPI